MSSNRSSPRPGRIIVVLGGTNTASGRLSPMCVRRLRFALALYRSLPERAAATFVLTGGHGDHFNTSSRPHWWYYRRWLLRHGVPLSALGFGVNSAKTPEDAQLTAHALRDLPAGNLDVVTSDFHARRAGVVFSHFLPRWQVQLHPAPCLAHFPPRRQTELTAHEEQRVAEYRAQGVPTQPAFQLRTRTVRLR